MEELPEGTYSFNYGFVEGGDFRYNVVQVEKEYVVAYNEVAAGVKLDVIFNEEYADGVTLEPLEDEPDKPVASENNLFTDDSPSTEESASEPVKQESTASRVLKRVGIAFAGAAVFTGIVFGVVYIIRKNSED